MEADVRHFRGRDSWLEIIVRERQGMTSTSFKEDPGKYLRTWEPDNKYILFNEALIQVTGASEVAQFAPFLAKRGRPSIFAVYFAMSSS